MNENIKGGLRVILGILMLIFVFVLFFALLTVAVFGLVKVSGALVQALKLWPL